MKKEETNPLLCDPEKRICEIPSATATTESTTIKSTNKPVQIIYFTDPICSSCWGIEAQLRKLKLEYGDNFEMDYRMGGLLKDWSYNSGGISKPSDVAHHWDEVSKYYDMPIDGDVWLEDPLPSSYPPSIAFKAAQMQDKEKALVFLRRLKEMVFLEKRNITKWEHIESAAEFANLDPVKLKSDFEGPAKQLFQDDLALAAKQGVRGFPTIFFSDNSGKQQMIYGVKPYETFESTLLSLLPSAKKGNIHTDYKALFSHYPSLTTKEYAVLSSLSKEQAEETLNKLFQGKKLSKLSTKNGALWKLENNK